MARLIRPFILFWLVVSLNASQAAQLPSQPILRLDTGGHTAAIRRIDADREGRWLVSASVDKTVRVWDAATGRMARVLRPPIGEGQEGQLYSVAISPDGRLVACGGVTKSASNFVYLFFRATGRLVSRTMGLPHAIEGLAFSPGGNLLAVTLGGSNGMRLFAVDSRSAVPSGQASGAAPLRLIAEDRNYADQSYGAHFSPDGRWLVTSSYDGYIRLYDLAFIHAPSESNKEVRPVVSQKAPGGTNPFSVKFSPDSSKLAVGFDDTTAVNVLSARDLRLLYSPDTTGVNRNLALTAWSSDGNFLFAGGEYTRKSKVGEWWERPARRWPAAGQGVPTDLATGAANTVLDMAPLPDGSLAIGSADPALTVLAHDGSQRWQVASSAGDFRGSPILFSGDGGKIAFAYKAYGKAPAMFSLTDHSLSFAEDRSLNLPRTTAPGLDIRDWYNTTAPMLNGKQLALGKDDTSRSLAIAPDGRSFLLGTDWYLRRFGRDGKEVWSIALAEAAWGVNIAGNGRAAVAALSDGTIRWYNYADGRELLAFFPHANQKRWVVWTPSGYYDASPGAEELIGWHVNNGRYKEADFFPASRFREIKYRPDIIRKVLETLDEAEAVRLADVERGKVSQKATLAQALPPVLNITAPEDGSRVSSTTVNVRFVIRSPNGEPVTSIRALVDGRPVAGGRGLKLAPKEEGEQTLSITIPARDCEVSLIAENRFAASVPATVRLAWASTQQTEEFVAKPKLYVLAVGESAYQKPELRLTYAAKDAKDFAAAMRTQKGGLYRDVEVKLLADSPKDDILDGLDWLRKQVTSRDVGIIFLAGHGVDDSSGIYYFLPANADPEKLMRTGLAFSDLKNTLQSIGGKAVIFVDTCHSGDVMGARRGVADINAVVNELASAENGVVVFAVSTGRQYSLEDPQWQNGAFTKALVEGISGKADYLGKGKITINMLDLYISERVKELTKGQQTPTTTKPSTVPDFPLALKQ